MTKQHRGAFFTSLDFLSLLWKLMLVSPQQFFKAWNSVQQNIPVTWCICGQEERTFSFHPISC